MSRFGQIVESLAARPRFSDMARSAVEGGFREHHALLRRMFPSPPASVLDLGCGSGIHAPVFASERYLGVDIQPEFIRHALEKTPGHRFAVMDARRLGLADGSFEAVLLSGVIHHLPDADAQIVLAETARVLRPDGRLLMWEDIPARQSWNLIGRAVHRLDVGGIIRRPEEYARLLEGSFEIVQAEEFRSGFMDYAAFLARPRSSELPPSPPVCFHP